MKAKKYLKVFEIEKSPADLSFEAFLNLYGYKESRKDAEKFLENLQKKEKSNALSKFQNIKRSWRNQQSRKPY